MFGLGPGNSFGMGDTNIGLDANSPWTFTLSGSFDGSGNLFLDGSLTDGSNNGSISGTIANGDVPSGEFMGFGARHGESGFQTDVSSFSVVPEPGAVALLMGLGSLAFVAIRRRSR